MAVAANSILDLIEAQFPLITQANGYNTTVKKIDRARLVAFKGYDLPAINFWPTNVNNVTSESLYGVDSRALPIMIEYHALTLDRPFSDVAGELASDVVTALNRSMAHPKVSDEPSFGLGGAVTDVVFEGYTYQIGTGQSPWCGALIEITVKYKSEVNDMINFEP